MKNIKYLLILFVTFGFSQDPSNSELAKQKFQKVRIHYNSKEELQQIIRDNEIDHFHQKKGFFIECEIPSENVSYLKSTGQKVDVLIDDMQKFVQENINSRVVSPTCSSPFEVTTPTNYNVGTMAGFLTYAECMAELDQMRTLYPDLISAKAPVGTFLTFENRSLQFVKISDNPNVYETEKRILYSAVHHAREPGSMQQLIYFMWYLLENYATNLEIKNLVDNTEIFCIPIVNPDGYIHNQTTNPAGSGMWRKNRRAHANGNFGVDNNRNYGYGWGTTGISLTDTNSDVYCGTAAFSESENQAVKWFCEQKSFLVAMNAHTFSSLVLYPFGNEINSPTVDDNIFKGISAEMVKYNGYVNQLAADLYPASGDSDDWMYADVSTKPKIFAFTPEVGNSFWDSPAQTVINNKNMVYTNLTALRFLHNYATFKDNTQNIIATNSFNFDFSITRLGLVENENFTIKIVPVSSNISSVPNQIVLSNLTYNTTTNRTFQLNLNPLTVQGELVSFNVEINNGTSTQSFNITKYFGSQTELVAQIENSLSQWTPTASGWGLTTQSFYSSNSSITDSPTGNYVSNKDSNIKIATPINLNNVIKAELSFYAKWDIEKSYDYVVLEVSNDNGNSWIPQCGKFTTLGSANQILNKPIYDGLQTNWVQESINLSDYIGSNILIRFRFKSDNTSNADGFYFDDLKVSVLNATPLSNNNFVFDDLKINQNPVASTLLLNSILGIENYKIYSISGQLLANEKLSIDKIDVNFLLNGVYFLELSKDDKKKTLKFVVQK